MIRAATAHAWVIGGCSHADSTKSSRLSAARVSGAARCTPESSSLCSSTTGRGAQGSPTAPVTRPSASAGGHELWVMAMPCLRARADRAEDSGGGEDEHADGVRGDLGRFGGAAQVGEQEGDDGRGQCPSGDC